jgi:hypothetical protein
MFERKVLMNVIHGTKVIQTISVVVGKTVYEVQQDLRKQGYPKTITVKRA